MKKWVLVFMLWVMPAWAVSPFNMGKMEYFSDGRKETDRGEKYAGAQADWREEIWAPRGPVYDTPPLAVLRLLEHPTVENARAYLAWQQRKARRMASAQRVLEQVQRGKEKR